MATRALQSNIFFTTMQLVGGNSALALTMTVVSNLLGIIIVSKVFL
jgi:predicted Na+-dependent transporter